MESRLKTLTLFYVGFTSYITLEVLFRGHSFFLMGLVGALCFLINDKINDWISWDIDLCLQGILGACVVTFFELVTGELDKHVLHIGMWDYSDMPFNFDGVICLTFSILWIFVSIYGIVLSDIINYYFLDYGQAPYYRILGRKIVLPERPGAPQE